MRWDSRSDCTFYSCCTACVCTDIVTMACKGPLTESCVKHATISDTDEKHPMHCTRSPLVQDVGMAMQSHQMRCCCLQDVDWANHPAECILAVTSKNKYVVKRKGLQLHDFGLVDAAAAKRQCAGQNDSSTDLCKVNAQMINDFEAYKKRFEKDTVEHMISRELDLGPILPCRMYCCYCDAIAI
jgi:hypothetical protein